VHESLGSAWLSQHFGPEVSEPVRLHVAAKRYLCFVDKQYFHGLSGASQASLALQGGAFDARQAAAFEQLSYWREAVTLRRFDDMGKRDDLCGRAFVDFRPLLRQAAKA